ncbi:MAG: outer membrane lipoprotein-sorting protein, partial [Pseudomonadota bacterium]
MDSSDGRGSVLAEAVYNRPDGASAVVLAKMTLRRARGSDRVREFYSFRMDFPDGEVRSLTRFTLPGNVAGVGLLVHSKAEAADDQWLFLPALERIRRISSENRGGRFVQSGLYYEDLRDRKPEKDRHEVLGEGDYEGTPVTLLQSTPIDPASSVYSRKVSWIHEPTL